MVKSGARDPAGRRKRMVERQLRRRGISDRRVLEAMAAVPRERFVPEAERRRAYHDGALSIGHGQTISQPWIVAAIAQALALEGTETVLDVGSGSGYSSAVLARLAGTVIAVERVEALAERSRATLTALGFANVEVVQTDGSVGLPERAPFAAVAVHARAPAAPAALLSQLELGGRLVVPIAAKSADMLTVFRRTEDAIDPGTGAGLEMASLGPTRFVPLIGRAGFRTSPDR